jgi:hypothetical protein
MAEDEADPTKIHICDSGTVGAMNRNSARDLAALRPKMLALGRAESSSLSSQDRSSQGRSSQDHSSQGRISAARTSPGSPQE